MGRATRRSIRTNTNTQTSAPSNMPITGALFQPVLGTSNMPQVNSTNAAVKLTVPLASSLLACGSLDSCIIGIAMSNANPPINAPETNTARQPICSISTPARIGPSARPTPKLVPSRLNALV